MDAASPRKVFFLATFFLVVVWPSIESSADEPAPRQDPARFSFRVHEIGRPGGKNFGQTSATDVDRDGDLDFISGQQFGTLFWFEHQSADKWVKHLIGEQARTDVGGVAFDVDGDGWADQVSGGTWYRNPGNPRAADRWRRFETGATPTHDNLTADIDGDGKLDLVSILDKAGVFWYRIPADPTDRWVEHQILGVTAPQCHGGIAVGDIDGDGDVDVSRVDRWLENADGKGGKWNERRTFECGKEGPWGIQTRARLVDVDRDGDLDLIQAEGDVLDGRVAWFENRSGNGTEWQRHIIKSTGHNQDFHSICVADFDLDGDPDIFSGGGPLTKGEPHWFVWENEDGMGHVWKEHLVQRGLETHESVCGDIDGDGDIDILTKPWRGDLHVYVENQLRAPAEYPRPAEGNAVLKDFKFASGESLAEVRIHYRTLGQPVRDSDGRVKNAILVLHGTGGAGSNFVEGAGRAMFAGVLFGKGQPLDATRYYIVLPDNIGHGNSSKPSDGLRGQFPHYRYEDMVRAQYRLLTEELKVDHLRLVMGTSMGGMHTWVWGQRYPDFMDALMPLASLPAQISGRNRMWRRIVIDAIRMDPDWNQGEYKTQPKSLRTAAQMLSLMSGNPIHRQKAGPTLKSADVMFDQEITRRLGSMDANDTLYAIESSADYDPAPGLESIRAPLLAINFGDDLINPPELGILEREISRVPNGRAILIPASEQTVGHGTHTKASIWSDQLDAFLRQTEK